MIDEKKLDNLTRVIAEALMNIFKDNPYCEEERELARDIWINGILVDNEKDKTGSEENNKNTVQESD